MDNDINELVNKINKENEDVINKYASLNSTVKSYDRQKVLLLDEYKYFHDTNTLKNILNKIESIINHIISSQNQVGFIKKYMLENWIVEYNKNTQVKMDDNYLELLKNNLEIFNSSIQKYLSEDYGLEEERLLNPLQNIAQSYIIIKFIIVNFERFSSNYTLSNINKGINEVTSKRAKTIKEISDFENYYKKYFNDLFDKLNAKECYYQENNQIFEINNNLKIVTNFLPNYKFCIGSTAVPDTLIASSTFVDRKKTISLYRNLYIDYKDGVSSNVIFYEVGNNTKINDFIKNLILSFVSSYPSIYKNVVVAFDGASDPNLLRINKINDCDKIKPFSFKPEPGSSVDIIVNKKDDITKIINRLYDHFLDIVNILGRSGANNIFEYNSDVAETNAGGSIKPLVLFIARDFPKGLNRYDETLQKFIEIYKEGNKCGIFTLLFYSNVNSDDDVSKSFKDFVKNADAKYRYEIQNDTYTCTNSKPHLTPLHCNKSFSLDNFINNLSNELKSRNETVLSLQKVVNTLSEEKKIDFSKVLYVPIGRNVLTTKITTLNFDASSNPHVIINGETGSGKTAFLHTLILSAANNYSPDQLKIELFDFKHGAGFTPFLKEKLPHIDFISTSNRVSDSIEVVKYIEATMNERLSKLGEYGGSIEAYNAGKSGKDLMPRLLVIIDEYQEIVEDDECVASLHSIVSKGRAAGIILVLASQQLPSQSNFMRIKNEIAHKFVFKANLNTIKQLIDEINAQAASELSEQKGLCFYKEGENQVAKLRIAFSGDSEALIENIKDIANKYPEVLYKRELKTVGNNNLLIINDADDVSQTFKNRNGSIISLVNDYKVEVAFNAYLGIGYLANNPISIKLDDTKPILVIGGSYVKSKQVILSLLNGMVNTLYELNEFDYTKIYIFDACNSTKLLNRESSFNYFIDELLKLENEGIQSVFSTIRFYDCSELDVLDDVYDEYCRRLQLKKENPRDYREQPIEVIIMGADYLSTDDEKIQHIRDILLNGKDLYIYMTIQFNYLDYKDRVYKSMFHQFLNSDIKQLNNFILLSNTDTPNELNRSFDTVMNEIDFTGRESKKNLIGRIGNEEVLDNVSFMFESTKFTKFKNYNFSNEWVKSFIDKFRR